jgi:hypothetical protein
MLGSSFVSFFIAESNEKKARPCVGKPFLFYALRKLYNNTYPLREKLWW